VGLSWVKGGKDKKRKNGGALCAGKRGGEKQRAGKRGKVVKTKWGGAHKGHSEKGRREANH